MSKIFGPTDSVADTLTALAPTTGYQFPPFDMTIVRIKIGKGNVVNAKECSGFIHITVPGVVGSPFVYAYGNGTGGATNSNNSAGEVIEPVRIPVPKNTTILVKVLDAEAAKNVEVNLQCVPGANILSGEMVLACGGAGQDTAAATALALAANAKLLGPNLTPWKDSVIRKIRVAGAGVVDAKAASGYLTLSIPGYPLPLEFGFGKGSGGAATSSESDADEIDGLNIPIKASSVIGVTVLTAEVDNSVSVTLQCD